MVREITLGEAGGAVTATLPRAMADRLRVGPGDRLFAIETPEGILLTPHDPSFDAAMDAFGEVRREYRDALRRLAE